MPQTQAFIFAHGELFQDSDSALLDTGIEVILIDVPFALDDALIGRRVSVVGHMGTPSTSTREKLIVDRLVSHDAIARRAFEIHASGEGRSEVDNWLTAEQELLRSEDKS